jgi:hypothetical protein
MVMEIVTIIVHLEFEKCWFNIGGVQKELEKVNKWKKIDWRYITWTLVDASRWANECNIRCVVIIDEDLRFSKLKN